MTDATLNFILKLQDELTAGLEKAKKQLETASKEYTKSFNNAKEASKEFAAGLTVVGAAVVGVGGYLVTQAGAAARARETFEALGKSYNGTALQLKPLRDATLGMVTDTDLMQNANKLMSMGLATNQEEMNKMMNTAVRLGGAMGAGPTEAMENFALMLANQSLPRLDTFGISSGKVRERIEQLTKANKGMTRETAFMMATMEQAEASLKRLGDYVPTPTERFNALMIKMQNMAVGLGEKLMPLFEKFVSVLEANLPAIESIATAVIEAAVAFAANEQAIKTVATLIAGALTPALIAGAASIGLMVARLAPWSLAMLGIQMAVEALYNAWVSNWGGMRDMILGAIAAMQPVIQTLQALMVQWGPTILAVASAFSAWHVALMVLVPAIQAAVVTVGGAITAFMALNPVLAALLLTIGLVVGGFISMQMQMAQINGFLDEYVGHMNRMREASEAMRGVLGSMNSDFAALMQQQELYAQAMATVAEKEKELAELGAQGYAMSHERAQALQREIDAAQAMADQYKTTFEDMAKNSEISSNALQQNLKQVYDASIRLGEDELQERVSLWQEEVREHERAIQERERNGEISHDMALSMMQQEVEVSRESLSEMLAANGDLTQQKVDMLRQYGLAFSQVGQAVVTMDAESLNNRLTMAADFHLQNAGLLKAFVNYSAQASNAELKAYGQKLQKEQEASNDFREQIRQLFSTPIVQTVSVQGNFFDKASGTVAQITSQVGNFFNKAVTAAGNYVKQIDGINAEFDATVKQIKAAESAGAKALDKLGGGGGGGGKGGGGGGKGNSELDKIKKQAEEVQKAFETMEEKYSDTQTKISDITDKLNADHEGKMEKFRDQIDKSRDEIAKLSDEYDKFVKGQGNDFGSAYIKAQQDMGATAQKIAEAQAQINDYALRGEGDAGSVAKAQNELAALQRQLAEQSAAIQKADQYMVMSKQDALDQIQQLEQQYNEQKNLYESTENIMAKARAQAAMEELKNSIDYKKLMAQDLSTEQQNLANGVARAEKEARQSDLENFLDSMEAKRLQEDQAFKDKVQSEKDKIAAVREQIVIEVDTHTNKMKAIHDIGLIMEQNHKQIMERMTQVTKDEIDKQIKKYNELAEAASRAASGARSMGVNYKSEGGVVYKAAGGVIPNFTPRGTDTVPAMLTPGEIVLTAAMQKNLASSITSRGNVYETHIHVDTLVGDQQWADKFLDGFVRKLQFSTPM